MQQMECHQPAKHQAAMEWWKIRTYGVQLKFKHHFERYQLKTFQNTCSIPEHHTHTNTLFFNHTAEPNKHKTFTIKPIRLITSPHLKQSQHKHNFPTANQNTQIQTNKNQLNINKNETKKKTKQNQLTYHRNKSNIWISRKIIRTGYQSPRKCRNMFFLQKFL